MQFDDVVLGRRSIRGYKSDPVPRALIGTDLPLPDIRSRGKNIIYQII